MKRTSTLYALLAIACAAAAAAAAQSVEPKQASSQHVELHKQGGNVEFFATGWPSALKIHGKGAGPEGAVRLDEGAVSGAVAFDLDTLETGIALRDRHLKENYLHTARYPRATLTLSRVELGALAGSSSFKNAAVPFEGVLSLHGAEKPVAGEARLTRDGARVQAAATFTIDIRDFGIDVPSYLGITVAEKVQVKVTFSTQLEPGREVAGR
jgi:polyisoprenoid-binding protein YceI